MTGRLQLVNDFISDKNVCDILQPKQPYSCKKCAAKQCKRRTIQLVRTMIDIKLRPSELKFITALNKLVITRIGIKFWSKRPIALYSCYVLVTIVHLYIQMLLNCSLAAFFGSACNLKQPKDNLITFVCINAL